MKRCRTFTLLALYVLSAAAAIVTANRTWWVVAAIFWLGSLISAIKDRPWNVR